MTRSALSCLLLLLAGACTGEGEHEDERSIPLSISAHDSLGLGFLTVPITVEIAEGKDLVRDSRDAGPGAVELSLRCGGRLAFDIRAEGYRPVKATTEVGDGSRSSMTISMEPIEERISLFKVLVVNEQVCEGRRVFVQRRSVAGDRREQWVLPVPTGDGASIPVGPMPVVLGFGPPDNAFDPASPFVPVERTVDRRTEGPWKVGLEVGGWVALPRAWIPEGDGTILLRGETATVRRVLVAGREDPEVIAIPPVPPGVYTLESPRSPTGEPVTVVVVGDAVTTCER